VQLFTAFSSLRRLRKCQFPSLCFLRTLRNSVSPLVGPCAGCASVNHLPFASCGHCATGFHPWMGFAQAAQVSITFPLLLADIAQLGFTLGWALRRLRKCQSPSPCFLRALRNWVRERWEAHRVVKPCIRWSKNGRVTAEPRNKAGQGTATRKIRAAASEITLIIVPDFSYTHQTLFLQFGYL
jgi:hypothetical protein